MLEHVSARGMHTVADLAMLGEDARIELIHGELVPKAAPIWVHSRSESSLLVWLGRRFDRGTSARWPAGWWICPQIHVGYDTHDVFCHDLAGWRRDRLPVQPTTWPVEIVPDWVCEILSPGHQKRDRIDKMSALHSAGVPHYWLLDHEERVLEMYRYEQAGYLLAGTASTGSTLFAEPFEAVPLVTDVIFGLADDED